MIDQTILQHKVEVTDGKRMWYVAELIGIVVEIDIETRILRYLWRIPGFSQPVSYRSLFYYEGRLYILPYYGNEIYIFDLENETYNTETLESCYHLMGGIERNGILYFFGCDSQIIVCSSTGTIIEYIDLKQHCPDVGVEDGLWLWTEAFMSKETIYLPVQNTNTIVLIDKDNGVSALVLGENSQKWLCRNIAIEEGVYHVLYTDKEGEECCTISETFDEYGKCIETRRINYPDDYISYPFVHALFINGDWYLLPYGTHKIYRFSTSNIRFDRVFEPQNNSAITGEVNGDYLCSIYLNNCIVSVNQIYGTMIEISLINGDVTEFELTYDKTKSQKVIDLFLRDPSCSKEIKDVVELADFLEFVKKG